MPIWFGGVVYHQISLAQSGWAPLGTTFPPASAARSAAPSLWKSATTTSSGFAAGRAGALMMFTGWWERMSRWGFVGQLYGFRLSLRQNILRRNTIGRILSLPGMKGCP